MVSDLESVDSANYEEPLINCNPAGINLFIKLETIVLACLEDRNFEDDVSTYSFLENLIEDTSNKRCCKLDENLLLATEDSDCFSYCSPEKSFTAASGKIYPEDRTSASTLQISNISFDY